MEDAIDRRSVLIGSVARGLTAYMSEGGTAGATARKAWGPSRAGSQ